MSPDQINITLLATIAQTIAICLQTLLGFAAIYLAFRWKTQLMGSKKIELALSINKAVREVKNIFISSADQTVTNDFPNRLILVRSKLEALDAIELDLSIFPDKIASAISEQIDLYRQQYKVLEASWQEIHAQGQGYPMSLNDRDKLVGEITTVTSKILTLISRYAH